MPEEGYKRKFEYEYLLHHVLLPRVLPAEYPENQEELELRLLSHIVESVENCSKWIPPATVRLFQSLQRTHETRTAENVANEINQLRPGEMFAMFIRQQNTAIMIHMPQTQSDINEMKIVNIATFPGNLHLEEFYNYPSDFMVTYPFQALEVKFSEMLRSPEFASQLCLLYDASLKKNQKQNYVNTWLTTILSDRDTIAARFSTIEKKVRDEVIGKTFKQQSHLDPNICMHQGNYFRRSNFYMALKALLQISLTEELGIACGRFTYKLIMLHFMARYCDAFGNAREFPVLKIDLIKQFLAKMARRIQKLSLMKSECVENSFYVEIVNKTKQTISNIRTRIDETFDTLHLDTQQLNPLTNLNFQTDFYQQVPNLRKYLEKRKSSKEKRDIYHTKLNIKSFKRLGMRQKTPPPFRMFDECRGEIACHLLFTDLENWILYKFDFNHIRLNCQQLWDCCRSYIRKGYHVGDALGVSKRLLVHLKLAAMIDRCASEMHPLLLEHHSGIDPAVFDVLLLPQSIDAKIALELRNYFVRRNANALYPSLIEPDTVSSTSFSVRFAEQSVEMQAARREILEMAERKIEQKRREWEDGRTKVERLRKKARRMSHDYYTFYTNLYGEKMLKHDLYCQLCELQNEINCVKIRQYEYPLPDCEIERNAIIFELGIPLEIAALIDALNYTSIFTTIRLDTAVFIENWVSNDQLSDHNRSKWSRSICLGSTKSAPMVSLHVDNDFSYFVVKNSWDCLYHACYVKVFPSIDIEALKKRCTLNLDLCSPYAVASQSCSNTTVQIQHELLADTASQCPRNRLLSQLKDLGSLRADDKIQKLYTIIVETESMSFDQLAVLAPILQAIWEIGKSGSVGQSHDDIIDRNFTNATIDMLDKFIEQQKDSWAHPVKLLLVTFITIQIFEFNSNESIADRLIDLLNAIRIVSVGWIEKIQQTFSHSENRTQSDEQSLRLSLVTASITGAMTFFVNAKHQFFNKIFKPNSSNGLTAPQTWLQSIITLNNNILFIESTSILRMLIRLVRYTGIHIESKVREIIQNDPSDDVFELIKRQWPRASNGKFKEYYFAENCSQVLVVYVDIDATTKHVTIDLITGTFLVDNLPIGRLPDNITSNPLFERVFGAHMFEVQPDANNTFTSVHKYNGCSYAFGWISAIELIITEHGKDGFERELIPISVIRGAFPELMAESYSHWWLKHKNIVEFRPKMFESKEFSEMSGIEYTLKLNISRLLDKTNRYMLDFKSQSCKRIRDHLARLEMQSYIHVWVQDNIATAELIRLNLTFTVDSSKPNDDGSYDMLSNEFCGMKVPLQQNCGTLYGLCNGLLLENIHDNNNESLQPSTKSLLMPHEQICCSLYDQPELCTKVFIGLNRSNPFFHRYRVDETMHQLVPCDNSLTAWVFLAHLHAVTSHGEIEPLTGMLGIERALQILQSSVVWSSEPYDFDAILTLINIAQLSPTRELGGNSQFVEWPYSWKNPENFALDLYPFIVRALLKDRRCFTTKNMNYSIYDQEEMKRKKYSELYRRDYMRCLPLLPNLRVDDDAFIDRNEIQTSLPSIPSICYSSNSRLISSLYHANAFAVPEYFDLKKFLTNRIELDGLIHVECVPHILDHNIYKSLTDMWISLYETARKRKLNREQFGLILSLLAHENADDEQFKAILALQAIASNSDKFMDGHYDPPPFDSYETLEGTFEAEKVSELLKSCCPELQDDNSERWSNAQRDNYKEKLKNDIERLTEFVALNWPCDSIDFGSAAFIKSSAIFISEANPKINAKLRIWKNNQKLYNFIEKVEKKLRELSPTNLIKPLDLNLSHSQPSQSPPKYEIDFEALILANFEKFKDISEEARKIWSEQRNSNRSADEWWSIYRHIVNSEENKHLVDAGMFPRIVPSLVLPRITCTKTDPKLKEIVGALALAVAHEQRTKRIKTDEKQPQLKPTLGRKLANEPHIGCWKPYEYPEWLLFEIEQNLTIHPNQIEVAKQCINSIDVETKHSVTQLDLSEEKTDIIVASLAAVFANGEQICQVIVSKAHFSIHLNSLRQYLSGMLNKRIYTPPRCQDMSVTGSFPKIINTYEECQKARGVILTSPEYRFSSQLENYKSVHKDDIKSGQNFLNIHRWIDADIRTISNGSDIILEIIRPVDNPSQLDGAINRNQ